MSVPALWQTERVVGGGQDKRRSAFVPVDRRILRSLDGHLVLSVCLLVIFGLIAIYSATHNMPGAAGETTSYVKRQAVWTVLGTLLVGVLITFDYRYFGRFSRVLYLGSLLSLVLVAVMGYTSMGAQRWLDLGPIPRWQPSEFVKIALIITLAKHLDQKEKLDSFSDLISPLVHMGLPILLILIQPDLGSCMIYTIICLGMLYMAGATPKHILLLSGGIIGAGALATFLSSMGWLPIIKEYQLKRLMVFINPYAYKHGAGWNVIQSIIAIGSGRFFGKGLFSGTQTQLSFLPSRHTDFIFSVVGEEMGFLGAVSLLGIYFWFLYRCLKTMMEVDNRFGRLLVSGVFFLFLAHLLINVGMCLGLMPITGKTLPFLSYGGSSTLANYAALGILFNVNMRRKKIHF